MALTSGTRLGPYQILSPLGAGGMGEVYRARDDRLKRDVAIKILHASVAADEDRLRRFEQEAQAAGALNHPNITAVYDLGSHEGSPYIVTELLEGETLRATLAGGALPIRKTMDYAMQTARALSVAHEKGIVHRDLKPENLFVTSTGHVKILDFGLARISQPAAVSGSETNLPTFAPATEPGVVLGTLGYMSPEQVRGKPADARSDIFSFGAILYEMLSGRRAFQGESAADTMSAILKEDPPDLSAADSRIPPGLQKIVQHCVEKNPASRFRSAHDLAFALEASPAGSSATQPIPRLGARPRHLRRWAVVVLVLTAVAAGAYVLGRLRTRKPVETAAPLHPFSFQQLTDTRGIKSGPTLSPDGKNVVYVAEADGHLGLYLLRVGGRKAAPLTAGSTSDNWQPAFSTDGEQIAFRSERDGGGIFLMSPTGESVKRLTDFGFNPTWSPDGREIAVSTSTFFSPDSVGGPGEGLWAVELATGKKRMVGKVRALQPSWSPHGARIAFWSLRKGSGQRDLWTVAANGSETATDGIAVTNDPALDWSPVWSPDGKFLYFSSNRGGTMNLWRVSIDEASGRVLGPPEPMTTPSIYSGELSFAREGRYFAFATLDWRTTLNRIELDPKSGRTIGSPVPLLRNAHPIRDFAIAPDGRWIAYMQTSNQEDIFLARTDGTEYRRLTDDTFRDRAPSFSPDGQHIAFASDRGGGWGIWWIRPDGSGLEKLAGRGAFALWSPDGSRIACTDFGSGWGLVDMTSNELPHAVRMMPAIDASSRFWPLTWSADGKRIAGPRVLSDGTSKEVMTFTVATEKYDKVFEDLEDNSFKIVTWLSDNRRLLVRGRKGISLLDTATGRGELLLAVRGQWVGGSASISRDDRWISYSETGSEGDIWLAELK